MKVKIKRDGIHWMRHSRTGGILVFEHRRFPAWPKQYGGTVEIEPDALTHEAIFEAAERCLRAAQSNDRLRGLNWQTLRFYYLPPDRFSPNTAISWKAAER